MKNSIKKSSGRNYLNDVYRRKSTIMPLYYYKYECQLWGVDDNYWY